VFSPDGRFLATAHTDQRVDLWDLFSIRRRLEELNLARGLPDIFMGNSAVAPRAEINRIELVGADPTGLRLLTVRQTLRQAGFVVRGLVEDGLVDADELRIRADLWDRLGQWRLAAADYRAALSRRPDYALAANNLAWCLVAGPGRGNIDEAVRWARKAVDLAPTDPDYRNTLGATLYRAGLVAEGAAILERNLVHNPGTTGNDWAFLAMCNQRLDKVHAARSALARAEQWRLPADRQTPVIIAEFQSVLKEARAIVYERLPDLPAGVKRTSQSLRV
jgi:Tfp pilus assembly protein PilF